MKLITRAQLDWPASAAPTQTSAKGVKVHYEGSPVSTKLLTDHDACIAEWKAIRRSHLANKAENYSDVAYNYAACPHGYLLEGRGIGKRTGANGNQALNQAHYAIVGLVGSSGLTEPTDAMLSAIRDGIELLRKHGAGSEIKGHRDGYATTCPGPKLYAWVQKGAPRPGGNTAEPAPAKPKYVPFPGASWFTTGRKSPIVAAMHNRLVAVGCNRYQSSADKDVIGSGDVASYEAWQRKCGYTGAAAKWPPGPTTWNKLQVPNV
ncbi:peptidoglycan-binding protein [Streptomyces sp. NBC_00006]|uniref:peptidoglycan-binding protein n=1 Tax=Streptomyces sp. NBC_00006 TaxID=2975619 RepID=UPI0022518260|nr:peptidoglycan-binding protein [Streptomyces sp. NBC_00006]MCX5537710.1 peptidoglycan-binding protein [Streptomyces sp. NBC_00006]MCX5537879.1 peptidoglycan-binding protein [Streptomyces sp. NBC_00006]